MFSGLRGAQGVHKERSHKGTRVDSGLAYPEKPQHLGENTSRACYVRTLLLRIRSYFIYLLPSYKQVHILLNICVSVFFLAWQRVARFRIYRGRINSRMTRPARCQKKMVTQIIIWNKFRNYC